MSISLLTLALLGTLSLLGSIVLGYSVPGTPALGYGVPGASAAIRSHFLVSLLATTLLVAAHSFIMFFLIATGVELKTMEKEKRWGDSFRKRTVAMKGKVFPVTTLALLLVVANFILGAAIHTGVLPPLVHETFAWLTFAVCLVALVREWQVLGDNNRLIEEAGLKRLTP
jgi:hypothetical protein